MTRGAACGCIIIWVITLMNQIAKLVNISIAVSAVRLTLHTHLPVHKSTGDVGVSMAPNIPLVQTDGEDLHPLSFHLLHVHRQRTWKVHAVKLCFFCVPFVFCVFKYVRVSHQDSLPPCDTRNLSIRSWRFLGEQGRWGLPWHRKEGRLPWCLPSCSNLSRQPGREKNHNPLSLSFLQCLIKYCYSVRRSVLTLVSLQSVVCCGSSCGGHVSASIKPLYITRAAVPTRLTLKGTYPWHCALTLHQGHIVYGDAPVKTRANSFKHQLKGASKVRKGVFAMKGDDVKRFIWCYHFLGFWLWLNKEYPDIWI